MDSTEALKKYIEAYEQHAETLDRRGNSNPIPGTRVVLKQLAARMKQTEEADTTSLRARVGSALGTLKLLIEEVKAIEPLAEARKQRAEALEKRTAALRARVAELETAGTAFLRWTQRVTKAGERQTAEVEFTGVLYRKIEEQEDHCTCCHGATCSEHDGAPEQRESVVEAVLCDREVCDAFRHLTMTIREWVKEPGLASTANAVLHAQRALVKAILASSATARLK